MTLDYLLAPYLSWALAHPYLTFVALLALVILYDRILNPRRKR